jgi:hypothetical protein
MGKKRDVCLGHQVLKSTHEIVRLGAADRPDTWRNITLLWLGKNSSKGRGICNNQQIPGKAFRFVIVAGYHEACSVGDGFEVVAVASQICLASPLHGPAKAIQFPAPGNNRWQCLNEQAGRSSAA